MAVLVVMPKLGLTMTEGKILRWLKKEGEWVEKGEPLLEILTEKIATEVESPGQGFLAKLLHHPDEIVPVTEIIAILAAEGEDISEYLKDFAEKPPEKQVKVSGLTASQTEYAITESGVAVPSEKVKISPLARRIAADKGLTCNDLSNIQGTGPDGRIVKKDVLSYSNSSKIKFPATAVDRTVPLTELRQVIARRMTQSWTSTPHFYLEAEVDVSALLALRSKYNKTRVNSDDNISLNDIIIKAVSIVLSRHNYINASFTEAGIVLKETINIGVAVGLDEGLIVPVLKNVDQKGLNQIAGESKGLIAKAREGKLTMDEITGGTFTISNLGMFSVDSFTAIINPPECAILSVGKIFDNLRLENGEVVSKSYMRINVGFDHRVVDGLTGAKFLADLKNTLENPLMMLL
jgi:pyruvate dehydrogenase E2 component (dihydrolipoamide acetyltransferase)